MESDEETRMELFSIIVHDIRRGESFYEASKSRILSQLSENLRTELFLLVCQKRHPDEWYESFLVIVGPVGTDVYIKGAKITEEAW